MLWPKYRWAVGVCLAWEKIWSINMESWVTDLSDLDGGAELVCRLNLWRMELFKYMKVGQAAVARCRHHTVATRRL